jgi:hypothetical protein
VCFLQKIVAEPGLCDSDAVDGGPVITIAHDDSEIGGVKYEAT